MLGHVGVAGETVEAESQQNPIVEERIVNKTDSIVKTSTGYGTFKEILGRYYVAGQQFLYRQVRRRIGIDRASISIVVWHGDRGAVLVKKSSRKELDTGRPFFAVKEQGVHAVAGRISIRAQWGEREEQAEHEERRPRLFTRVTTRAPTRLTSCFSSELSSGKRCC